MYVHNLHVFQYVYPDEFQWAILFRGKNSHYSHHNWMNIILNILMWEKIILCRRPRWACVPMKSHFSPQNRPEVIHRPFVCCWHRDKAHKRPEDGYVSSLLVNLSPPGLAPSSLLFSLGCAIWCLLPWTGRVSVPARRGGRGWMYLSTSCRNPHRPDMRCNSAVNGWSVGRSL